MWVLLAEVSPQGRITPPDLKLFSGSIDTAGTVVIVLFFAALFVAAIVALGGYIHQKRLERLPAILGRPRQLLDEAGTAVELTITDRYLLNKLARRLRLPQPVSILLSPVLLVNAGRLWRRTQYPASAKQWGINKLNRLAKVIYQQDLNQLAREMTSARAKVPGAR